ncbi:MAG TPA: Dam family site-specific DNA-(adenine-N6)-methyltransferase [Bacilli bacterium]|nr:Dam family site-specific DNA-(adenine-N6)-methyltransferase [Bacilli bacterium]
MKPFVKWAGGKRQILTKINEFIDDSADGDDSYTYIEPFLGGGAVFFSKRPRRAIINDLNEDLINAYRVIKSDDYLELIRLLRIHSVNYKEGPDDYYYEVRGWDREEGWPTNHNNVERASRMIFLNRTCYNGLYRVNGKGQFNTPIGRYKNPTICDEPNIVEIHNYLSSRENDIRIMCSSYEEVVKLAKDGDIIYLDPPYDYEDDDGFTKYQLAGFEFEDFVKLKGECDKALNKGAFVVISNNATQKVLHLFEEDPKYKIFYDVSEFPTLRSINCNGAERKTGREAIFWGMDNNVPFPQANNMEKIIRLVLYGPEILENKEKAMEIIEVSSTRQVAYYFSALQFFRYLTHDKKFSEKALSLYKDRGLLIDDIYSQLLLDKMFESFYERFKNEKAVDISIIKQVIKQNNKKLSESTINRRSSTIKAWVEWMKSIDSKR